MQTKQLELAVRSHRTHQSLHGRSRQRHLVTPQSLQTHKQFFQVSVLQSFVKCHRQMVPRKKNLRIITSLVSLFTGVLARECCCLRVCREQLTGEGSTHRNSPLPGSLLVSAALQGSYFTQNEFEAPVLK